MDWMSLKYWEGVEHPEAWPALLSAIATLLGVIAVILAAYLTYHFTLRHSNLTRNAQLNIDHLKRDVDALEKVWGLLSYMSFVESDYSIVRWDKQGKGNNVITKHFFHFGNLKHFMFKALNDVFYKEKAGLHLPQEIREQLFKYRGLLAGLYFKHKNDNGLEDDSIIEIINPELVKQLQVSYDSLRESLKTELATRYRKMQA